ncbi:hypothetical protein B0H13DRAFT_1921262 [Mycena leptocephala]|nr:hypothetical protein B0H13DRAFT_1921262 [Mycena leptocephala]
MDKAKLPKDKRIQFAVGYCDYQTVREWRSLASYRDTDFEAFKSEVLDQYPSVRDKERRTLRELKSTLKGFQTSRICVTDEDSLMALIRALRFQVKKLLEAPARISQCEAIWRFLDCLTSEFVEHIDMREAASQILASESVGTGSVTHEDSGELIDEMAVSIETEGNSESEQKDEFLSAAKIVQ